MTVALVEQIDITPTLTETLTTVTQIRPLALTPPPAEVTNDATEAEIERARAYLWQHEDHGILVVLAERFDSPQAFQIGSPGLLAVMATAWADTDSEPMALWEREEAIAAAVTIGRAFEWGA